VNPREGRVEAEVSWFFRVRGPSPQREITAYLTNAAELEDISSPDGKLTWSRAPSFLPFFSAASVVFDPPVPPGSRLRLNFRYRLERTTKQTGLTAMSMSLGPDTLYLFECWYPTPEPFVDSNTFVRKVQKPPFRFTVTVPPDFTAVTVGELLEDKTEKRKRIFRYECGTPAPFLIPLVVARFERTVYTRSGTTVNLLFPRPIDEARAGRFCDFVARAAAAQARVLERPEPRTITVALAETGGLARGFPHLLILSPYLLGFWESPESKSTICHELSHTYFGNLVTAYGPGGNEFLSEGLATFTGIKTVGMLEGKEIEHALFRRERRLYFESKVEDVAIVQVRPMQNVLSGEVYRKGALIFNEMTRYLGEKKVWRILATYLRERQGGYAALADFREIIRRGASPDMSAFFRQYLETIDLPWIELVSWRSTEAEAGRWSTELRLRNRGSGFGLAPVGFSGSPDGNRWEIRSFFVPAGSVKDFTVQTAFRPVRCVLDPEGTFLNGLRRASLLNRAKELRQKGKTEAARREYEKLLALLPRDGEVWYGLGRTEERAGGLERAVECYAKAAEAGGPLWLPTWGWLREAECLEKLGKPVRAEHLLRQVLSEGRDIYGAREKARRLLEKLEKKNKE